MSDPPVPELRAAAAARAAKRTRQSSPVKKSKHRTGEAHEMIEPLQTGCAESQVEDALSSLPLELQAIIIGNLDIKSIYNLHAAGYRRLQGLVKDCQFSAKSIFSANSLKSEFFVDISGYLRELNLSGVPDLNLPTLLNALSNMRNLNNLDVSYTNVIMEDFLQIVEVRPTLKSIAINFILNIPKRDLWSELRSLDNPIRPMSDKMVTGYQQAFARFEDVHFVGDLFEYDRGGLAGLLLEKASLFNLKYTVTNDSNMTPRINLLRPVKEVTFTQFQMYYLKALNAFHLHIYTTMDFKKYEILLFVVRSRQPADKIQDVYATPLLSNMICDQSGVQVTCLSEPVSLSELRSKVYVHHNILEANTNVDTAVFFWDRQRTDFDSAFSSKLLTIFKEHFVFSVSGTPPAAEGQWYSVQPRQPPLDMSLSRQPDVQLDYGSVFKDKRDVKLKILFNASFRPQTRLKLINKFDFFKKLSHLCLCGNFNCDADFFKDVFAQCESLTTLEIMTEWFYDTTSLQYLKVSKTLKNILILASSVDMLTLFAHLSECSSLENICLCMSEELSCLPDPTNLFSQCANLYNMYINLGPFYEYREEMLKFYKRVKCDLGKDSLTLVISTTRKVRYHTHLGVFKIFNSLVPI